MVTSFIFGKDMYIIRAIIQTENEMQKQNATRIGGIRMKNRMKKLAAMVLGVVMLVGANATPIYGATGHQHSSVNPKMDREPGVLNGVSVSAYVVVNDEFSATAGTGFSGYGATCKATVRLYYCDTQKDYYSTSTNSTSQSDGISAKVYKQLPVDIIGAKGIHAVTYGAYSWKPTTQVGVALSSATKK